MDKWTYTILNIWFFVPSIVFFWFGIYRKLFFKRWKFMLISGLVGVGYFFAVDVPATALKAWEFGYSKTLGISVGTSVLEELIWMILVFMTVALIIEVLIEKRK